jgi:glycerol transport system ATP-binding protein
MTLELDAVTKVVAGRTHIHPTRLRLERGSMNVLLGPTLSGKTTLMRLMAGLDAPTSGRILVDGADVTGMRVQDRKVAMVYQ